MPSSIGSTYSQFKRIKVHKRILMVNRGIFRVPLGFSGGGAEKHGYYLANHIAKLGHEVFFISKIRPGASFHSMVKVHRVPPRRWVIPPKTSFFGWVLKHLFGNILSFITGLRILAKQHFRFHVIHCHGALTALLLSKLIGWKIPVVYTMHDPSPWIVSYQRMRGLFRKLAYLMIEVPCLRSVRRLITVCPALHDEAIRWGKTASEVTFIPNGVTIPSSRRRSSPNETPYGIFVGHLVPRKRADLLVKALSKLTDLNIRFVVVGDGPERLKLMRLAKLLGVDDRITFTGYIDDESLTNYYAGASFFVFPSEAESFGLATFEAMAYGLPVIVAHLSVYDRILVHGKNALMFEAKNIDELIKCIKTLVLDDKLRQGLSSIGFSLVRKQFSWGKVAKKILSVYEQVSARAQLE